MGKGDSEEDKCAAGTFYSSVGERIKRWWKNLERYGFDISIADFENRIVENERVDDLSEGAFFVGDPYDQGSISGLNLGK